MNKKQIAQAVALTAFICAGTASAADTGTIESRIERLESQVDQLNTENKELRKQLGWDTKNDVNVVQHKGKVSKMSLGGYIQAQFGVGDAPDARFTGSKENDSFTIRRARISLTGSFAENFDFKIQSEFAGYGSSQRAQLTDGFVNWNRYSFANVKLGQFKTPFGYDQLTPDTKVLTVERSLPNDFLTFSRQLGVGVWGNVLEKRLRYNVGMFNGNDANNGLNDNDSFMFAGRVEGTVLKQKVGDHELNWNVGVNGIHSDDTAASVKGFNFRTNPTGAANNTFAGTRYGFGADTQASWGRFGLFAEYLWMNFQPDNGNLTATTLDDDFASNGFYVGGTFDFVPKKWQALVRYEVLDTENGNGAADGRDIVLGLNYYIKGDDVKLMANYIIGDPVGRDREGRLLLRAQVSF